MGGECTFFHRSVDSSPLDGFALKCLVQELVEADAARGMRTPGLPVSEMRLVHAGTGVEITDEFTDWRSGFRSDWTSRANEVVRVEYRSTWERSAFGSD